MIFKSLQILLIVLVPVLAMKLCSRYRLASYMSPIVICFAIGILVGNLNLIPVDIGISGVFRDVSVLYALPLLLLSSDVMAWLRHSRSTLLSFFMAILSGAMAILIASVLFKNTIGDIWIPAGMMGGIHTGGTPNLFAVGIALNAGDEVITLTNSAQILWGAINLLFLLSVAKKFFGLFLRNHSFDNSKDEAAYANYLNYEELSVRDVFLSIFLVNIIVALAVFISYEVFDKIESTLIIVFVTTMAIMFSFSKSIRSLRGSFELGDYCLLMFGVAVGMLSDFRELAKDGQSYILFAGFIMVTTMLFQLLCSKLLKIDRDTFIITFTAAIYGPVFIPQVAQALNNKYLILGGIAVSLIGLAIGNYVGISLAYFIKFLLF